jgi:ribonuclease BN (tRNA processing enzyme)
VQVTVVGSGDAFGSGGRFQTCFALTPDRSPSRTVLVDCGATSLTAMRQLGMDLNSVSTVLVSHLHGDHFGGLPFLVLDGQFRRRTEDLTVVGPPGTRRRLLHTMEALYPGSTKVRRRFDVQVVEHVDHRAVDLEGMRVQPLEVRHASGAPAYALRVEWEGGSAAYSGDTEWTDALLDAADGVDLFLCEGYSERPTRWHLDLDTLSRHRDRLTCQRLVLTHLSPSALDLDLSDWTVAHDGLRVQLE